MQQSRRDFIKSSAVAATAAAAGLSAPGTASLGAATGDGIRWDKAPCRFCGTGCSVLVLLSLKKVESFWSEIC